MSDAPRLAADWFDGRSARARPVEVWLDGAMLHYGEHSAPLARVTWPERQRHGQRQVLLPEGGMLSFADAGSFDAWALSSGRVDSVVVRWQQSWRLALLSLVLLVAGLAAAYRWGLPWAVDRAVDVVPHGVERELGEHVLEVLDGEMLKPSQLGAAQQQAWRERWAAALGRARADGPAGLVPEHFEIHFRAGSKAMGPNAFALPGGDVVITDALLQLLDDEPDAVMTVLAHELGHVRHRHSLRLMLRAGAVGVVTSVLVGDFSTLLAAAPALLATNAYSRDHEREADVYGRTLARAGGADTSRMAVFFERVAKEHAGVDNNPVAIAISSHPADEERVRFFSER